MAVRRTGGRAGHVPACQNFDVAAHEASGDERTELWRELIAANRYLPSVHD
jgi:hypothetical protein